MIDFVKLHTTYQPIIKHFQQSNLLFTTGKNERLNKHTSEYLYYEIKEYNGILFTFYTCTSKNNQQYIKLIIELKPHYIFNSNIHNANRFKYSDCIKVISKFIDTFKLSAVQCLQLKVVGIESGANFLAHFKQRNYGKELISKVTLHGVNKFINHDGLPFSKRSFYENKHGKKSEIIQDKFYCKGIQLNEGVPFSRFCDIDTLRYEFKSKRYQWINKYLKIDTFLDLLNIEPYKLASEILIERFKSVIICDTKTSFDNLNVRQINQLKKYYNPLLWYPILKKRNAVSRRLKSYNNLLDKTGFNIHKELLQIVKKEVSFLVDFEIENVAYISGYELLKLEGVSDYEKEVLICKFREIENVAYISECTIDICNVFGNNNTNINQPKNDLKNQPTNQPPKTPKCKYTNISLKHEKKGAYKIGMATVKWLRKNDPKKFSLLCSIYVSRSSTNINLEGKILKAIANKNRYKNTDSTYLKKYNNPNQTNLI